MAKSQKVGSQPPKKQKPTSDSTAFFNTAEKSYMFTANSESKKGNEAVSKKMIGLAKKANADKNRQSLKGKSGYDANGNPIKKKK
jgi:hypothetical protein